MGTMTQTTTSRRLDRTEARRQMYRALILEGAEREFARVGFSDAKVQDIASASDVSLATLYKTFAGKDDIYDAVHLMRMRELIAYATDSLSEIESHFDRLLVAIARQTEYFTTHPNYLRMHIRDGQSWATASEIGKINPKSAAATWRAGIAMMNDGVKAAIDAEEIVPLRPELVTGIIISALQVWLTDWFESGEDRPTAEVGNELTRHLRRSFGNLPSDGDLTLSSEPMNGQPSRREQNS